MDQKKKTWPLKSLQLPLLCVNCQTKAPTQDEAKVPLAQTVASKKRHVQIEATIQPIQPAHKLDGHFSDDEDRHTKDEMACLLA